MQQDFVAPPDEVVTGLVADVLRAAGESDDPTRWRRIEHGSANLVILAGRVAVRVSRTPAAAAEAVRAQRLIDLLPPLPFALPRSVAAPAHAGQIVAIAQERVAGEPHPSGSGDGAQLRRLLDAVREVPLAPLAPHLAHRDAYLGGGAWRGILTDRVIPLLDPAARVRARAAADALAALDAAPELFTHGDLAGANVMWSGGAVSAVIDWDLAAADDESKDVAALATWHGWNALAGIVPSETLARARTIAATYPLQLVSFAVVGARPQAEIDRAVARANNRYADASASSAARS